MNPFAGVTLHTLGRFALAYREQPCELAYEKGRALLIFLAMEPGRTYSRASLASMLWPELEREAALTNLRQILLNLRQAFSRLGVGVHGTARRCLRPCACTCGAFCCIEPFQGFDTQFGLFCVVSSRGCRWWGRSGRGGCRH